MLNEFSQQIAIDELQNKVNEIIDRVNFLNSKIEELESFFEIIIEPSGEEG